MNFGEKIYEYRERKGLSQRQLAESAGINSGTLSRIEAGKLQPAFDVAINLVNALGAPYREFFPLLNNNSDNHDSDKSIIKKKVELAKRVTEMTPLQKLVFLKIYDVIKAIPPKQA